MIGALGTVLPDPVGLLGSVEPFRARLGRAGPGVHTDISPPAPSPSAWCPSRSSRSPHSIIRQREARQGGGLEVRPPREAAGRVPMDQLERLTQQGGTTRYYWGGRLQGSGGRSG